MATTRRLSVVEQDDPLDLGDLIPETMPVKIKRNGQIVTLTGHAYDTAPVSMYANIAQAHDRYAALREDPTVYAVHREQALAEFYGHVSRALVPDLTYEEMDRLAGDFPRMRRLLQALGYLKPAEATSEGEAPAAESITEPSSPSSEPSTAATTQTG